MTSIKLHCVYGLFCIQHFENTNFFVLKRLKYYPILNFYQSYFVKYVPDKLWSTLTVWGAREEGGEVIRTLDTLLICSKSTWIQIFSSHWDPVLKRIQQQIFFFCFLSPLRFCVLSLYCTVFTVQSAAPQTALWGGPRPRSEHQMGSLEAGDTAHKTPTSP